MPIERPSVSLDERWYKRVVQPSLPLTPADVIDDFNVASLVTTGLFWLTLGGFTGLLYRRFA